MSGREADDDPPVMTGWLIKDGDGVRAELVDLLGAVTIMTGTPEVRNGVRGYALVARLGAVPEHLRMPWEEDVPS
jgi:hypothetical protein